MAEVEKDPYIGETFEDLDPRSRGRRIRVVSVTVTRLGKRKYKADRVNEYGDKVGRSTTVSAKTLDELYRKVSR